MPAPGGVSLELTAHRDDSAALPPLDMAGEFTASIDPSGTRKLNRFSDDELFAASDSVFGLLDDPADMARSELLATYDEIAWKSAAARSAASPNPS